MDACKLVDTLASVRHAMGLLHTRQECGRRPGVDQIRESMTSSLASHLRQVVEALAKAPLHDELRLLAGANPESANVHDRSYESYTAAVLQLSKNALRTFHAAYDPESDYCFSTFDYNDFAAWYGTAARKLPETVWLPEFRDIEWLQLRIRKERQRARLNMNPLTSPITLVEFKKRHPLLPSVEKLRNLFLDDANSPKPVEQKTVNQPPRFSYADLRQFAATRWPEALG